MLFRPCPIATREHKGVEEPMAAWKGSIDLTGKGAGVGRPNYLENVLYLEMPRVDT